MSNNVKLTILIVPCILCVIVAGYMAVNQIDNWGWFLFAAIILMLSRFGDDNEQE